MPQKVQMVSGRKDPAILRMILYIFMFIVGLWIVHCVCYVRKGTNSIQEQDKTNDASRNSNRWQSFLWNTAENEADVELDDCNFENYIFRQRVNQSDPCLIATVKKNILLPPPPPNELNNETLPKKGQMPSNIEKLKWVEKLIIENTNYQRNLRWPGFFIECGANDGSFISPTIRLERNHKWTGLLVEANPSPFQKLKEKKRNAWAANVAACTTEYPDQLTFYTNPADINTGTAGLTPRQRFKLSSNFTVQCIPMYTMLAALEVNTVDYFSLDVEGFELAVLKTIPFDKIQFMVMTIEYYWVPGKQEALKNFLEPKGYKFVKEISDRLTKDCLYVHESLYELASSIKV